MPDEHDVSIQLFVGREMRQFPVKGGNETVVLELEREQIVDVVEFH
jgi:hypothetical protein